ncbi:hypothetical protein [Aquabacterium sp.]|uniref:hypothetical protein n=1 Tax=Aquabacterium sp. TaxID=1872578 RepID=UPI002BE57617|nr:hypothetical protein [Aquabacterium sp.]HSW07757.1 hypothetical protein [Aquabacterium sp.]
MSLTLAIRLFGQAPPRYRDLLAAAEQADEMFLPRIEPGWVGSALALLGLAAGLWWARSQPTGGGFGMGWLALAMILLGMLIQLTRRHMDSGWQLDLQHRLITPVGLAGEPVQIGGDDYSLVCTAGDRKRSLAIDLRHAQRGRVARLFQTPGPVRLGDHRVLSALTDVLARRLQVGREGLTV